MSLKQTGTVQEYLDKFDELLNFADLHDDQAISFFINGLKPEISLQVRLMFPRTLIRACSMAKAKGVEETLELQKKFIVSSISSRFFTQRSGPILPSPRVGGSSA